MKLDKYCISDEHYYENTTFISFVITRDCSAGCWYCHWNGVDDAHESLDFNKVLEFIDIQGNNNVHFTFYGGEPTQSINLIPYMNILNNRYKHIKMVLITNLLKSIDYFQYISSIQNLRVIASYHSDVVPDIADWLKKVDLFDDIHVRLMMTEDNKNVIIKLWGELSYNYNVHIKPIEQMGVTHESDHDPETPVTHKHPRITQFRYMMCSAGFVIRENGDVFKCWEDTKKILNLNTETIPKINKWSLCLHDNCTCGQRFPKLSIKEYRICQETRN